MSGSMTEKLIEALRPSLDHDHPQWMANHYICGKSLGEMIDKHQFGYHISTMKTTILQRNLELVVITEDLTPVFPLAVFLPLTEKQWTVIRNIPTHITVGQLGVYHLPVPGPIPGGKQEYIYFAAMHKMLECRTGVKGYFDAVNHMQRELSKLLERIERTIRTEVHPYHDRM